MSIKAFKLTLGYDILAEVVSEESGHFVLNHPMGIAIIEVRDPQTNQPVASVSLQEVLDFANDIEKDNTCLYKNAVVFSYEPSHLLTAEYKKLTSGLILPPSAF